MCKLLCTTLIALLLISNNAFAIVQVLPAEQVFYYHTDPSGTPLAMTDSSGNVVWKADYKPFGEEQSVTETVPNDKRFIGKEKDEETGFSYFGARYEEARIGRFITPDPERAVDPKTSKTNEDMLLNPQRLNTYAYALNNPYRFVDTNGLSPQDRVNWAFKQLNSNKDYWKGEIFRENKCNEFVAAAHSRDADPDAGKYPSAKHGNYNTPTVSDLADPNFAKDRLDYIRVTGITQIVQQAKPGDIIVWYDSNPDHNVHHSAIYVGDGNVAYQNADAGVKTRAISSIIKQYRLNPIIRRYKY